MNGIVILSEAPEGRAVEGPRLCAHETEALRQRERCAFASRRMTMTVLFLMLAGPIGLRAQWTVQPHGWFMSQTISKGTIPDRFDPGVGAIANGLDKVDWGLYFIYGLTDGLSVGMGQGFTHLEDNHDGTTTTTTGFGATGLFATGPAASTHRFSFPYSKRKAFAVGKTPCSRATSAAAAHKGSGIGKRPVCELRHRCKRR